MSLYGIFSKPTQSNAAFDTITDRFKLAQYDSDDDAMKALGAEQVRAWLRDLPPEWQTLLAKVRSKRKAHVQVAMFLYLVGIAASAGWSPDMTKLRGSGAVDYVRVDKRVYTRWTLLRKPLGRGPYRVVSSGNAKDMIMAFLYARETSERKKKRGKTARALMLVCPGNWVAAQWKP